MKTPSKLPTLLSLLAASAFTAKGAVLVYEGFNYSNVGDDLDAITTVDVAPTGLTGSWSDASANTEMFIKSDNLLFSDLAASGNHIGYESNSNNDRFNIGLDGTATSGITTTGASNGTLYFSFLFEKLQNNFSAGEGGFALTNQVVGNSRIFENGGATALNGLAGFGIAPNTAGNNLYAWGWDGTSRIDGDAALTANPANGNSNTSGSNLSATSVLMLVGEISFNTGTSGADVFNFYNVTDDGSLDTSDLVLIDTIEVDMDESTLDTLNLTRQTNLNYDEVRITTTLEEALGIPEPSAALLGGLGILAMFRRRRS